MGITKFPSCTEGLGINRGLVWREAAEKVQEGLLLPDRLCTFSMVAKMLGVNQTTFSGWFKVGVLPKSMIVSCYGVKHVNGFRVGRELVKKLHFITKIYGV